MDNKVTTCFTLWNLVDIDQKDHKIKELAKLLFDGMKDWPTFNQTEISDFIKELKIYFGDPLTITGINSRKFDGINGWKVEAGWSIAELIRISTEFCNESHFDKIVDNILSYYNDEFNKVDFIA